VAGWRDGRPTSGRVKAEAFTSGSANGPYCCAPCKLLRRWSDGRKVKRRRSDRGAAPRPLLPRRFMGSMRTWVSLPAKGSRRFCWRFSPTRHFRSPPLRTPLPCVLPNPSLLCGMIVVRCGASLLLSAARVQTSQVCVYCASLPRVMSVCSRAAQVCGACNQWPAGCGADRGSHFLGCGGCR
jgi:hypothetical protein